MLNIKFHKYSKPIKPVLSCWVEMEAKIKKIVFLYYCYYYSFLKIYLFTKMNKIKSFNRSTDIKF